MIGRQIFRKAALERLASPERLDQLMQVTSPMGWLALSALGFIIVATVVWSVVGKISIKVEGQGILMRGGAVYEVNSMGSGHILSVEVMPGQMVKKGQVVARLDQPELRLKIENTRAELAALTGHGAEQTAAQRRLLAQYRQRLKQLREKVQTQRRLVEKGLLTKSQLMATEAEITATEEAIANLKMVRAGSQQQIEKVRARLRELEAELEALSEVRSPYEGRVVEVTVRPGDLIGAGERILILEDVSEPLKAVLFVPAGEGKKVKPGMMAHIAPTTVKPEEYGFIKGQVVEVSEYPLTPDAVVHILRNEQLAQQFTGKSAAFQVTVKLETDPETYSGFKWTSSSGPPMKVASGTICSGSIQVETKKPISYVIPLFKKAVGIS